MGKEFPANQCHFSFQNLLMAKFVASGKVREVFDISPETLRWWAVKGVVNARAIRTLAGVERGCMILNRSVVVWNQEWISLHYRWKCSSRRCVRSITSKSWFTLTNNAVNKSQKTWKRKNSRTSSPSLTFSLPDEMERKQKSCDDSDESKHEKKVTPHSVMKIKLNPTPEQKVLLKKMFGTHRAI
ncbi:hypothetical protein PC116_g12417 [Phytophthora cactorum]|nr:hypothetical protein PC116_g12417 [Phytophthora cactorum]